MAKQLKDKSEKPEGNKNEEPQKSQEATTSGENDGPNPPSDEDVP